MSERFETVRASLVCPTCQGELAAEGDGFDCGRCRRFYPRVGGKPCLRRGAADGAEELYHESLRGRLRTRPTLYRWIFRLFAPVLVTGPCVGKRLGPLAEKGGLVLDVGGGNDRRHAQFVNVDLLPYPEVDVLADAEALPFGDETVAGIASVAVLEHLRRPELFLAEARRVLRPGGRLFIAVPFLQPFHAAPFDFRRWTLVGLDATVDDDASFRILQRGIYAGPASALAWILAEWLGLALSLGIPPVAALLSPLFQVLCSPIKWLDLLLCRFRGAEKLASVIYIDAEKV